jgi:hypothetical protein
MVDEPEKVTEDVIVAQLEAHFGEWVIKRCMHKGEPGVLFKTPSGQVFCAVVHEVSGIIITT